MLKTLLRGKRWMLLLCALLCTAAAVTNLALLDFLNKQVAAPSLAGGAWLPRYSLGVLALFVSKMSASALLVFISTGALADIRKQLLNAILATDYTDVEKLGKGALLGVLTDDIDNLANGMTEAPHFLMHGITTSVCFGYLAWLSPYAFMWFIGAVVLGVAVMILILRRGNARYAQYRRLKDSYYVHMHALFDGAKELATNPSRRRHFAQQELLPSVDALKRSQLSWDLYWHLGHAWGGGLLFVALGIAIAAVQYSSGNSAGVALNYFVVITFVSGSIDFLIGSASTLAKAFVSANAVSRIDVTKAAPPATPLDPHVYEQWEEIEFDGVTYVNSREDEGKFMLGPVSLTLRRGETIFLVGGNGSGKSTFAKVANGLLQRSGGAIRVDGRLIDPNTPPAYRALYSTVYSDYHLFSSVLDRDGTLVDEATVAPRLGQLGLADKVSCFDGKWSTTALSQGQRKRLALIQCMLDGAPICLLDEWPADQDPGYRAYFYQVLLPSLKAEGKTLVVISHDDHYFHLADRVCKFNDGQLEEQWTGATSERFSCA